MSWAAQIVIALVIFMSGAAGGIKWHEGKDAIAAQAAAEAAQSDALQLHRFADKTAGTHAAALARVNNQLGDAREKLALLSDRQCLDAGTVGVLNTIGSVPEVGAAAGGTAQAGTAAAAGTGLRYSTERDVAGHIALCRARYAELASEVNGIQDVEDRREALLLKQ